MVPGFFITIQRGNPVDYYPPPPPPPLPGRPCGILIGVTTYVEVLYTAREIAHTFSPHNNISCRIHLSQMDGYASFCNNNNFRNCAWSLYWGHTEKNLCICNLQFLLLSRSPALSNCWCLNVVGNCCLFLRGLVARNCGWNGVSSPRRLCCCRRLLLLRTPNPRGSLQLQENRIGGWFFGFDMIWASVVTIYLFGRGWGGF